MNHYDGVPKATGVLARTVHAMGEGSPFIRRQAGRALTLLQLVVAPIRCAQLAWHLLMIRRLGARRVGRKASGADRTVVMLVVSNLTVDPRVRRGAQALARHGHRVHVICPAWAGSDGAVLDWGEHVTFQLVEPSKNSFIFPYLWEPNLHRAAVAADPWAIHCHDLNTCPAGLSAAVKTGAHCVCDFHEWYSENVSYKRFTERFAPHPWYKRGLYRLAEGIVLRTASVVIIVCDSLAELLAQAFRSERSIEVVRNIPRFQASDEPGRDLREALQLPSDTFVLLYQGGVGPSRYLEPIIRAMPFMPNVTFVIRGPGIEQYGERYRKLAQSMGALDRLHCLPPVPSDRVTAEAASADAGIWSLEDLCLNFRHALPNKIFEYLSAGLPIVVSDYPETQRIVDAYGVGACFDSDSPESIAEAVRSLADHPDRLETCRKNIPAALRAMDPDAEWMKLVELYRGLG